MTCAYEGCIEDGYGLLSLCREHTYQAELVLVGGVRIEVPCEWCGIRSTPMGHNKCHTCRRSAPCDLCGAPRAKSSVTGLCKACYAATGEQQRFGREGQRKAISLRQQHEMEAAA